MSGAQTRLPAVPAPPEREPEPRTGAGRRMPVPNPRGARPRRRRVARVVAPACSSSRSSGSGSCTRPSGRSTTSSSRRRPRSPRRCGRTARCSGTTCSSPRRRSASACSSRSCSASGWPSRCTSRSPCAAARTRCSSRSQAVPIVIIAPLLVVWFGFGIVPKLAIIALVCFFPVVVTTLDALGNVDPDQIKLLRTLDASRWQAFRYAEAPAALPAALSGAKIAVAVAVIGAVFAEYAGSSSGLGHLMLQAIPQLETAARLRRRGAARRVRRRPLLRPRPGRAPARALGQPPTGRTPRVMPIRRLTCALLAVVCALGARRLRREAGVDRAGQARVGARHARLLPERRPRRAVRRAGHGRVPARRARRLDADAVGPVGAAEAAGRRARSTSRSPTSPSCCSPATRARSSSPSGRSCRSR